MPDFHKNPLNLQEYMDSQHANPFEAHHGAAGRAGHGEPATAPGNGKEGAH
jgi:hypothetical protein